MTNLGPAHRHANKFLCPHCGYTLDSSSGVDNGGTPSPGDVTLCIDCGEGAIYVKAGATMLLRKPTEAETELMLTMPLFVTAQATIRRVNKARMKKAPGRTRGQ